MSTGRSRVVLFTSALLVGVIATLALTVAASALFGQKVVAIDDADMEPTLSEGDLIVARQGEPADVEPGELMTFSAPGSGRTLTRRVRRLVELRDAVVFETEAEAIPGIERFSIPLDGQVAEPRRRIPLAGAAWDALIGPGALLLVPLAILLAIAVGELSRRLLPRSGP